MSSSTELHVIGAGGHAKVVIATARAAGFVRITAHDDDPLAHGREILGAPVVGGCDVILGEPAAVAVLAIGNNATRRRLAERARCRFAPAIVHPRAHVEPTARLGDGSVVFAGAVIQVEAAIGRHVIINTGATVDHDCALGDYVHLAPGVHLAGAATLGEGAFLGIGTVVTPERRIGAWTVVGAGGAVVRDLPENAVAMGVPARIKEPA